MLEIGGLNREEDLALIGLLKAVIQADKKLTFDENEELKRVATLMGSRFHERVEEARNMFVTLSDIKGYVKGITRKPARQLIFNVVLEMAKQDEMLAQEDDLLEWLATTWELEYFRR